jgi:membrane protease YdiL (CAAX protease family)
MTRRRTRVLAFVALACAFSWSLAALFHTLGGRWYTRGAIIVGIPYMFGPLFAAVIVARFLAHEPVRESLGISFKLNRWFAVAWLLPVGIAFFAFVAALALPGVAYSPDMVGLLERFRGTLSPEQLDRLRAQHAALPMHPLAIGIILALIAGPTLNAAAAFGEEAGWRGFLQRELGPLGFWKASALIGVVWGFWHAPVILMGHNYPHHPYLGVLMMVVFTVLLAPVIAYVRIRANSVIAAAVAHGSVNASAGLAIVLIRGGTELTTGISGLAGFIVLVVVNVVIWSYHRMTGRPICTACSSGREQLHE